MTISNNLSGIRPGVCTSTTRPTVPYTGQHIFETDTLSGYVWNGLAWKMFNGTVIVDTLSVDAINAGTTLPKATNSYDLGSAALRWRNIYTQDLHLSNGIGDYTVVEGEEELYLVNNKSKKSFKFALIEVDSSEVPKLSET